MSSLYFVPGVSTSQPNPAQLDFMRRIRKNRRCFFRAGWGTGKTTLGAFLAQRYAHLNPGVKGLIASQNHNHVVINLIPRIIEHLKAAGTFLGHHQNKRLIYLTNDAIIQYGSANRPASLDGNDVGWYIFDEIRHWPKESYDVGDSRMRDKRAAYPVAIMLSTPDMNWVYDEFAEDISLIETVSSTHANSANLRPNYVEDQLRRLSSPLANLFIYAQWGSMEDAAFPEFDAKRHVQKGLAFGVRAVHPCIDFGKNRPAVTYLTKHDFCKRHGTRDCIHAVGELVVDNVPTYKLVHRLKEDLDKRGWRALTCYVDPAGSNENEQTGRRDIELFEEEGFEVEYSYDKAITSRVNSTEHLRGFLDPVIGEPRLYLDDSLATGSQLEGYRGIRDGLARAKSDPKKPGAYLKDQHYEDALDSLRYGVCNLIQPVSQQDTVQGW